MGIIDGEYRPHEDLFARALSLLTSLWGFPIFLAITWIAVSLSDSFTSTRSSGIVFGGAVILTLIGTLVFAAQCICSCIRGFRQRSEINSLSGGLRKRHIIFSLGTALAACGFPLLSFAAHRGTPPGTLFRALAPTGVLLSIIWCATTAESFARYGKRALWLLAGLPFAFSWPFWIAALWLGCFSGNCV